VDNNHKIIGKPNEKVPAYVKVYEHLYDEIKGGAYKGGEQLPPEVKLAETYQISRNTLRQAIAILCEDGLVFNVQGKGNFVSPNYDQIPLGLETLNNSIFTAAKTECDEIKMYYNYAPPAKVVQEKLNITASDISLVSNNVYYSKGKPISHAFYQLPVMYISAMGIDLNDEHCVHDLLNKKIYDVSSTSSFRISFSVTEESISEYLEVKQGTHVIFIEELLFNSTGNAIALCKYYLLPAYYSINIIRKK